MMENFIKIDSAKNFTLIRMFLIFFRKSSPSFNATNAKSTLIFVYVAVYLRNVAFINLRKKSANIF